MALPELPPEKEKKHLPKFVSLIVLIILVGGGACGYVWYSQSVQQIGDEIIPVFTPRVDSSTSLTTSWKTYTNARFGFSLLYPASLNYVDNSSKTYGDGSSGNVEFNYLSGTKQRAFSIIINPSGMGLGEGCENSITSSKVINGATVSYVDYCGLVVSQFSQKGNFYVLISDSSNFSQTQFEQILSTFKFTKPSQGQTACTQEAKQCPDGSYVSRTGPNCEFTACP